jgi:hypothetical protein
MTDREELTLSVPEAASRYFGLGKNAAYAAAARVRFQRSRSGGCCASPCARSNACWNAPASRRRDHTLADAHMLALR